MPRVFRDTLVSARELAVTAGPFVLLAVALLAGAYYLLKPTPPKRVVLATGSEQGAYAAFGKRYQEELKRFGIEVVLRPTAGSRENLRLLQDRKQDVQIAFVQGGASESRRNVETTEQDEKLRRAIDKLPENQRQVLLLRYYSNLKFVEIADMLGCPLNTALGRVHKAILKLRQLMGEE